MYPQNFEVSQPIPQAQLVICLELVSMAGSADALQVLSTVWISCSQSPNEPRWHNVIHMAPRSSLLEILSAHLHFAASPQSRNAMTLPASPGRSCTGPLPVHPLPTHRLFLRPKPCLTELAAAVTVCLAAKKLSFEDFCLAIPAVRTTHGSEPSFSWNDWSQKDTLRSG